jgi:hypothetical protein
MLLDDGTSGVGQLNTIGACKKENIREVVKSLMYMVKLIQFW